MSFDIFFQPCRFTIGPAREGHAPASDRQPAVRDEPLSSDELKAVQQVLTRVKARGPNRNGCYVVQLDDGGSAEVYGRELATGCMVRVWGLTAGLLGFLFDLLAAGRWVMLSPMADTAAITTSPQSLKAIPAGFPRVVACNSAEELGRLLADGVEAWQRYRAQVLADDGQRR